jgi:hypothetical protein
MTGIEHLHRPRHGREKMIKWILKKKDVSVSIGLIWLRIGTSSRLLRTWQ